MQNLNYIRIIPCSSKFSVAFRYSDSEIKSSISHIVVVLNHFGMASSCVRYFFSKILVFVNSIFPLINPL